jgi:hypothetical protein
MIYLWVQIYSICNLPVGIDSRALVEEIEDDVDRRQNNNRLPGDTEVNNI